MVYHRRSRSTPTPLTGESVVWSMNFPIGSESQITGRWQDPDNDLITAPSFVMTQNDVIIVGSLDDGNEFSQSEQPWAFSSVNFSLADDNTEFKIVITDDQGNQASAVRHIAFWIEDPLRLLINHPNPRNTNHIFGETRLYVWDFVGPLPTFDLDGASGGSSWVVTSSTGFGGGLEIPTAPGVSIEMFANAAAGTAGDWEPKFRFLNPDEFTQVSVEMYLNGLLEDFWEVPDPPERIDHTDLPAPDDINVELLFPGTINLQDGDSLRFIFKTVHLPGNTAGNLAFWEFSDIDQTTQVAAPGTLFFDWSAGDINATQWTAYRDSLPPGVAQRPVGQNNTKLTFNAHSTGAPYRWHATQGYEVAELDPDGSFRFRRDQVPSQDKHNQLVPSGGWGAWITSFYLRPQRNYRFDFGMTLGGLPLSSWLLINSGPSILFRTLLDIHPGGWPSGFGDVQAPISLQVSNGTWQFKTRGSTEVLPTDYTSSVSDDWTFDQSSLGYHDFRLETRFDFTGALGGHTRLWMDGIQRADNNVPVGINHSGATIANSMFVKVGCYTNQDGIVTQLHYFQIREL